MPFYITRSNALKKLLISEKIFDWLCFLNNISAYYPRKNEKKNKMVYFLSKDIKTIKNDKTLFKIYQISDWKRKIRIYTNKKKSNQIINSLKNIPSYKLDSFIKKKFIFFRKAFNIFKNLFSFVLLISYKFENNSIDINAFSKFFHIKKKFLFIFSSLKKPKKIFVTKHAIHIEYKIFGKKTEIYFPQKIFFIYKKKFFDILSEYYICLYNFILKKLLVFYNFQFLNGLYIEKFDIFNSVHEFIRRNYKLKKIKLYTISIFLRKNLKITQTFNKKNKYYIEKKKNSWTFSKNINLPYESCLLKNPIFYIENRYSAEPFILILKSLRCKILFKRNHEKVTHILSENQNQEYSLIVLNFGFFFICNILNTQSILPIFLSRIENLKHNIVNSFCSKIKKKKITHFRKIYGKKKLFLKEISNTIINNWVFKYLFEKKKEKQKTDFFKKKMTFTKIF
jgi:hypothetical protein